MAHKGEMRLMSGSHPRRKPWQRGIALFMLTQLAAAGCGPGIQAPATTPAPPPEQPADVAPHLSRYAVQLEKEGISLEEARAYLAGERTLAGASASGVGGLNHRELDPSPALEGLAAADRELQQPAQEFVTWKLVDGVAEYRIGPQDILQLTVFLGPEAPAAMTYRVQADGTIYLPRFDIGSVTAGGKTPTELSRDISDSLRRYVPSAFVDVRVSEFNAWDATLGGEVRVGQGIGPGTYPLRGRITAGEFIFSHGGPTAAADLSDVRLVRNGVEQRFNLAGALSGQGGENPAIDAGDIVRVPSTATGSSRYYVWGEVGQPGVFTVSEELSALDAIAQAGSVTPQAATREIYVARPATGEVLPLNLDIVLGEADFAGDVRIQAGDFIVVPALDRTFWEKTRDWIGLTSLVIGVATVVELVRRD
jgi:polysaccharide export outer membrane protein